MDLSLLKRITRDILKLKTNKKLMSLDDHVQAAMEWLSSAQDVNSDGGVSLRYSYIRGWDASYPETTGYIIPNFFEYTRLTGNEEYFQRAVKMAEWELSIQQKDGSFKGGAFGSGYDSFVFDTGQVLFGLISAHKATSQKKYIDGAIRAAKWLTEVQDFEGMWKKFTFHSIPHTYYTRVAWALAELGVYLKDDTFINAACKNIDWTLSKQNKKGWFAMSGFTEEANSAPYTHTIAYTMEGILETGACLNKTDYIKAVIPAADSLCHVIHKNGYCQATYNSNWESDSKFSCLTGNAQIALILLRLYEFYGKEQYLVTAQSLNRSLCELQDIAKSSAIRGAIAGSFPVWGKYQRFAFPNWAVKFFVDALLLEKKITGK